VTGDDQAVSAHEKLRQEMLLVKIHAAVDEALDAFFRQRAMGARATSRQQRVQRAG